MEHLVILFLINSLKYDGIDSYLNSNLRRI